MWQQRLLGLVALAAIQAVASGCAIRLQAPVREVSYDFSDADFYGRNYAPSPSYRVAGRQHAGAEHRRSLRSAKAASLPPATREWQRAPQRPKVVIVRSRSVQPTVSGNLGRHGRAAERTRSPVEPTTRIGRLTVPVR